MPSMRSDRVFALVDGNNFYVSCERVFNPRLEGRPVIVLSNNDGCAVARSQEAKDMGIVMGEPGTPSYVIINNKLLREGDRGADFAVDKIEHNRVVFVYKGEKIGSVFRRY